MYSTFLQIDGGGRIPRSPGGFIPLESRVGCSAGPRKPPREGDAAPRRTGALAGTDHDQPQPRQDITGAVRGRQGRLLHGQDSRERGEVRTSQH